MGVDVDPARGDEPSGGVDDALRITDVVVRIGIDDRDDDAVIDRHIRHAAGPAGAIDEKSPTDHEIMHEPTVVAATFGLTVKRAL